MSGTTLTSNLATGYYLGGSVTNPVTVTTGVTISNTNNPALGSTLTTYWSILNFGTLLATGANSYSDGVLLFGGGGAVTNAASASITGYDIGVSIAGSGTVANYGTIATGATSGTGYLYTTSGFTATTAGVRVGGGGVYNAPAGVISSYLEGVAVAGGGSVVNAGSIRASSPKHGFGIVLTAGGQVTNTGSGKILAGSNGILAFTDPATVVNAGSVYARYNLGVGLIGGGMLTNQAGGEISGYTDGVSVDGNGASTIINAGFIYGYHNSGAFLARGGSVTNTGTGLIDGKYFGLQVGNHPGTVLNMATIASTATLSATNGATFASAGVQLAAGGSVTNAAGGFIESKWMGVQIGGLTANVSGTVVNYGTILAADVKGDGAGIWVHGPGQITNATGGVISGGAFGIVAYYQTTLTNQGTVFGTEFAFDALGAGFANRIIDLPGGVFSGTVAGGNTLGSAIYSTLELASGSSIGTIGNIGTFTGFARIALDTGATWSVGGTFVAGETVTFGGGNDQLILTDPALAAATMANFGDGDTIVLSGITDVSRLQFGSDNALAVFETAHAGLTLKFDAQPNLTWSVVDGSTDITVVPCFLPGTHILTDRGEVLVEKLRVGDTIVTASGQHRKLCWIGNGRALATRGRRNAATPVIVRKGALADNVPHLDLHVTKGHALYIDNVLIPVEFLVNHRSILWDDRAQEVTVFHLELDAHDVLVANGAAAESYRDDGNRWLFSNANAGWDQPPKPPCAPVLTSGETVDAIWHRLLDRAGPRPGVPLTDDPDLHLLADGQRVDTHEIQGSVHVFRLSHTPESLHIASREGVPAELGLARDSRSLGVALRRVIVRQGTKFVVLKASDTSLTDGFHPHEPATGLRWTDGRATLPATAFAHMRGGVEVVLDVAATTKYPNQGGTRAAA